jgi:hypothetical protein
METKFTWRTVLWAAVQDTWGYFEGDKLRTAIVSAVWMAVSALVLFGYNALRRERALGEAAVMEVFKEWALLVAAVAALWVLGVFLWKLWMAPVRIMEASLDAMKKQIQDQTWSIYAEKSAREHFSEGWASKLSNLYKRVDNLGDPPLQIHKVRETAKALWDLNRSVAAIDYLSGWATTFEAERTRLADYDSWPERMNESPGSVGENWSDAVARLKVRFHDVEAYVSVELGDDLTKHLSKPKFPLRSARNEQNLQDPIRQAAYREVFHTGESYLAATRGMISGLRSRRDDAMRKLREAFP